MRTAERLVASGLGSDLSKLTVADGLAEAYRNAGQHVEASPAFEPLRADDRIGRDRTEKAGTLLNNWGLARYLLGHPQEAEQLFRRAVDIASADAVGRQRVADAARPISPVQCWNWAASMKQSS